MSPDQWDKINQSIKETQFNLGVTLPLGWKYQSYNLKHAADHIFDLYYNATIRDLERMIEKPRVEGTKILEGEELEDAWDQSLISVYFLLVGYAIETLLKAILVFKNAEPTSKSNDKYIETIKTHNLEWLCSQCEFKLQLHEVELLRQLTDYVVWMGKYPIPTKPKDMYPKEKADGTWEHRGTPFRGRRTQEEVDALYHKIHSFLDHLQSAGES